MKQEVTNARRMAQTAWIALALYAFFGFHQIGELVNNEVVVKTRIGGVDLDIPKIYLNWGFSLFSFYATAFFYYIAFQKNRSPSAARQYLLNFNDQKLPVELMRNTGVVEMGTFRSYIATFFPKLDPYSFIITKPHTSGYVSDQTKTSITDRFNSQWPEGGVNWKTKFLCCIENVLYTYPLFLNVGVWVFYLYTVFFEKV